MGNKSSLITEPRVKHKYKLRPPPFLIIQRRPQLRRPQPSSNTTVAHEETSRETYGDSAQEGKTAEFWASHQETCDGL